MRVEKVGKRWCKSASGRWVECDCEVSPPPPVCPPGEFLCPKTWCWPNCLTVSISGVTLGQCIPNNAEQSSRTEGVVNGTYCTFLSIQPSIQWSTGGLIQLPTVIDYSFDGTICGGDVKFEHSYEPYEVKVLFPQKMSSTQYRVWAYINVLPNQGSPAFAWGYRDFATLEEIIVGLLTGIEIPNLNGIANAEFNIPESAGRGGSITIKGCCSEVPQDSIDCCKTHNDLMKVRWSFRNYNPSYQPICASVPESGEVDAHYNAGSGEYEATTIWGRVHVQEVTIFGANGRRFAAYQVYFDDDVHAGFSGTAWGNCCKASFATALANQSVEFFNYHPCKDYGLGFENNIDLDITVTRQRCKDEQGNCVPITAGVNCSTGKCGSGNACTDVVEIPA